MDGYIIDLVKKNYQQESLFESYDLQNIQNILHPLLEKLREVKIFKIVNNDIHDQIKQQEINTITIKPLNCFENLESQPQEQFPLNYNNFELQSHLNLINQDCSQNIMKNQKLGDSLSKKQLEDIEQYGAFTTQLQEGQQQKWQISQNLYIQKTEMQIKYKSKNLLEKYNIILSEDTNKRIRSKKWKYFRLNQRYINFKDGIYTLFFDVPFQLLNCLIGVPVTIKKKLGLDEYLQSNFIDVQPEINYLKRLNIFNQKDIQDQLLNYPIIDLISEIVRQLKWTEFLFSQKQNLDLYIEIEVLKNILSLNVLKLNNQDYQRVFETVLGIFIINSFKEKIKSSQSTCIELFNDCLSFLNYYQLESFQKKLLKIQNKFESVSKSKAYKDLPADSFLASRQKYFWKIEQNWKNNTLLFFINILIGNLIYGNFGIKVNLWDINNTTQVITLNNNFP
ncbi:hypothetical protein TTHERM_00548390 (macronuclear) [Tetrahymena thermophila SB210]|uniref:Uncharacterized protein n=1 Tax=Tetrahymena thermophila (strain SB210) TaxID=312017 RepID=I7MDA7_TETTS|nr:hypothetical protein TTHERM_00548390 [Tetrahymena thermophila SB210]EAR86092.2 hypothetical protein TTHERM_00548390 [Tetrahymena thermophila SB210]|eukprot:XP_976687.2 hypothetical protein TTHERM_00548390 [Tetrahymena thermophila SB210]